MTSTFGLPTNYTAHPLYQQYMLMMQQSLQQQALQQQALQQQAIAKEKQAQSQAIQTAMQNNVVSQAPATASEIKGDQLDDGKISFGSKLKNFGKGIGKFFTGMVCDDSGKFSWKRTLTTVAVAAGAVALTVATGGAATPFLIAAGATMGTIQVGKGTYKAITAKTDKEAEKAWQDIGSGTTAVVATVAGAKGALKSAGKVDVSGYKGVTGALKSTGKCFTESFKMSQKGYNNLRTDFSGTLSNAKDVGWANLKAKFNNENALIAFKEKSVSKFDKEIARLEKNIANTTDAKKLTDLNNKLSMQKANREILIKQMSTMEGKMPNEYQSVIDKSKRDLASFEETLAKIKEESGNPLKRTASEKRLIKQHKDAINHIKNEIKTLEEYKKIASGSYKKANGETIRTNKDIVNAYKEDIQKYTTQLQKETNPAARKILQDKIDVVKKDIEIFKKTNITKSTTIKENYALAKAKYYTPGIKELKTNRLWTGAAAVNNGLLPSIKIAPDMLSQEDAYAQANGFQSAEQMKNYIQTMQNSQAALNNADNVLAQTNLNSYQNNQYASNIFSTMQTPFENGLGFNELYASPYPEMI